MAAPSQKELHSLYLNLGGEAKIEAILIDFYERLAKDVLVGFFFDGKNPREIAIKQKAFLLRAMGATKDYSGRTPDQAHEFLPPILPGHFDRRIQLLEETLRDHQINEKDMRIWIEFEKAFRRIVTKSPKK